MTIHIDGFNWSKLPAETERVYRERHDRMRAGKLDEPLTWWRLTYRIDGEWRAATHVRAVDFLTAVCEARSQGCSVGGHVTGRDLGAIELPPQYVHAVLSWDECELCNEVLGLADGGP